MVIFWCWSQNHKGIIDKGQAIYVKRSEKGERKMKKGQNIKSSMVQWHSNTAIKEVTDSMEKRPSIKSMIGLGLLAVAAVFLAMLLTEAPAQGAVNCTNDLDCDGFTDTEENNGITLNDGTPFPSCVGTSLDRALCLDPNTPDLFVILISAIPSNLPANPLEYVSRPQAEGGLGIAAHVITSAQAGPGREITSAQKAVRITENPDNSVGGILGVSNYGTPNGLDLATIYPLRIINHVTAVYADVGKVPPAGLTDIYIAHTLAHEISHMLALAVDYNKRFGGNHFKTGSGVVMDQSVKYTIKGSKVTFYVGTSYADQSKQGVVLK
jgi:hypothetical protein